MPPYRTNPARGDYCFTTCGDGLRVTTTDPVKVAEGHHEVRLSFLKFRTVTMEIEPMEMVARQTVQSNQDSTAGLELLTQETIALKFVVTLMTISGTVVMMGTL